MAKFKIVVTAGDGIGPEVIAEGVKVLKAVGKKYGHTFDFRYELLGGSAIDATGEALTKETLAECIKADAVLLGAVGGPKWDNPAAKVHPEDGLLALRKGMGLYANLRPVKVLPMLVDGTNLKPDVVRGVDLIVVRELTGGLYFGRPKRRYTTTRGRRDGDLSRLHRRTRASHAQPQSAERRREWQKNRLAGESACPTGAAAPYQRQCHIKETIPRRPRPEGLAQSAELKAKRNGGEGEIRTPGPRKGSTVFETAAIDHSATSPRQNQCIMRLCRIWLSAWSTPDPAVLRSALGQVRAWPR